jgi:hypothetical protein
MIVGVDGCNRPEAPRNDLNVQASGVFPQSAILPIFGACAVGCPGSHDEDRLPKDFSEPASLQIDVELNIQR